MNVFKKQALPAEQDLPNDSLSNKISLCYLLAVVFLGWATEPFSIWAADDSTVFFTALGSENPGLFF